MNKKDLRIIFLGNPEFARFHLQRIVDEGFNVVAVISAADKPAGRGMKTLSTPVTQYAREQNIPCLQPTNLKNPAFLAELKSYNADLQVVIAFRMLPTLVWDMPPIGTYNLHASLLPQYRGAAPINWAIINGETETGVSTFKLKHEIDTGDLLVQKKCTISATDNVGSLHDKLMYLGAAAIIETLDTLLDKSSTPIPQVATNDLKSAPKIFTETTVIDWSKSTKQVNNFIRGLCPYPAARTRFDNKNLLVYEVEIVSEEVITDCGTYFTDGKSYLAVQCANGILKLADIKLEGKRRMSCTDLLNGYDISHLKLTAL
jgi:methionyl-tRNA formyltransferase